jgi:hypothetical protein
MTVSTIVAQAVQLSGTETGVIYVFDEREQAFRLRATYGLSEELIAAIENQYVGTSDARKIVAMTTRLKGAHWASRDLRLPRLGTRDSISEGWYYSNDASAAGKDARRGRRAPR